MGALGVAGIRGCVVSASQLASRLGLRYPFECTVEGTVESFRDIEELALEAVDWLSAVAGGGLALGGGHVGWEYIGRAFNLYSFTLNARGVGAGVLRVVEAAGSPLGVYGAFRAGAVVVLPGLEGVELAGSVRVGNPIEGPVYLKPVEAPQPPGQAWGRFITYYVEGRPPRPPRRWELKVKGPRGAASYGLRDIWERASSVRVDFHCVTGWSVREVEWVGVPLLDLLREAGAGTPAWIAAVSDTGYSAVIPGEYAPDALVAVGINGKPLDEERGAPLRLVVPPLYGWKSVKRLSEVVALDEYQDGYWEALGYHERGLAAAIERFKVRNREIAASGRLSLEGARPLKP